MLDFETALRSITSAHLLLLLECELLVRAHVQHVAGVLADDLGEGLVQVALLLAEKVRLLLRRVHGRDGFTLAVLVHVVRDVLAHLVLADEDFRPA